MKIVGQTCTFFADFYYLKALDERDAKIAGTAKDIKAGAERRRKEASRESRTNRPRTYLCTGLEERRAPRCCPTVWRTSTTTT